MKPSFLQTSPKLPLQSRPATLFMILTMMLFFSLKGFSQNMNQPLAMNQTDIAFAIVDNDIEMNFIEKEIIDSQDGLNDSDLVDLDADLVELESEVENTEDDLVELEELILESTDNILESEEEKEELAYAITDQELEEEIIGLEDDFAIGLMEIIDNQGETIQTQAKELEQAMQEIEALKAMLEHTDIDLINND